jgi:hypothetical protein
MDVPVKLLGYQKEYFARQGQKENYHEKHIHIWGLPEEFP